MAEFSFTYRAFISYAHADHQWAVWLHRALERYRVPQRLAGAEGLKRLGKCFRDEEELAAAAELGPTIEKALQSSDVLIVVCSPRSAKSKWVNQEIEAFKNYGREHRVFALIVDGEPHGAPDAAGNPTECFPPALKVTAAGGVAEPLAVDVRKFGRDDAAIRLIAGVLEVGYDDLRQREIRRRRAELLRAQTLFVSGIALVALALTGGFFAASNYVSSSEEKSKLFAREAGTLFTEGQYAKSMLISLYADPAAEAGIAEQLLRPEGYPAARSALFRALTHNRLIRTIQVGSGVSSVAFSPDGSKILTGFDDGTAQLWPAGDGEALAAFKAGEVAVASVGFSPDGTKVFTGCIDGTTKLWRLEGGNAITTFIGPVDAVQRHVSNISVALSPDGTRLLVGYNNGMIKLWPVDGGATLLAFKASEGRVNSVAFSPDGRTLLVATADLDVSLMSAVDGQVLTRFSGHRNAARSVAFSPDGNLVVTGSEDGTAKLWSAGGGEALITFAGHDGAVTSATFSPDGTTVLTGSTDGTVKLWRLNSENAVATFVGHGDYVSSVTFSPDGKQILTGSADHTAKLWLARSEARATFAGHEEAVTSIAFSRDGQKVFTGSRDGTAKLWNAAGGPARATFNKQSPVNSIAVSSDAKNLLTGSDDGEVVSWSLNDESGSEGKQLATLPLERIVSVAFSPDGVEVLIQSYSAVEWRPADGSAGRKAITNGAISATISPDGGRILTGSQDGTAKLWPAVGGEPIATFTGHDGQVRAVAFSADGKSILTGSLDGTAKVWPAEGGAAVATFAVHRNRFEYSGVDSVAFSPDGRFVLTGSDNGSAQLWPSEGGDVLETFKLNSGVNSVAFSPDGATVLTGSSDKTASLWQIDPVLFARPSEQVRAACAKLKEIGVTELSEADFVRFPILNRHAPHPCAKIWAES